MQFLEYSGYYKKISKKLYRFDSNDDIEISCAPLTIVPPIYDIPFKKVFSYTKLGLETARDFLNSLFFPKSQSIIQLKCIEKEIPSSSHLKHDEGSKIMDYACVAKVKYYKKVNGKMMLKEKEVLIDFEMESNYRKMNIQKNILIMQQDSEAEMITKKHGWLLYVLIGLRNREVKKLIDLM